MTKSFAVLLAFAALTACGKSEPPGDAAKAKEKSGQALATMTEFTSEQMNLYQTEVAMRLDKLGELIEALSAKAESSAAYAKTEVREKITELREKRTAAQLKLEELHVATGKAWGDMAAGMDEALHDLENAYVTAAARFK